MNYNKNINIYYIYLYYKMSEKNKLDHEYDPIKYKKYYQVMESFNKFLLDGKIMIGYKIIKLT